MEVSKKIKQKYFYKYFIPPTISTAIGVLIGIYWKNLHNTNVMWLFILTVFIFWGLFYGLPLITLYLNHLSYTKKITFSFDSSSKTCYFSSEKEAKKFSFEEIEKVIMFISFPRFYKRVDRFYFGHFYYCQILFKDGSSIKLPGWTFDEIKQEIPISLIEKEKRFWPLIDGYLSTL